MQKVITNVKILMQVNKDDELIDISDQITYFEFKSFKVQLDCSNSNLPKQIYYLVVRGYNDDRLIYNNEYHGLLLAEFWSDENGCRLSYVMQDSNEIHDSDCSQHNEPMLPKGPCDCSLADRQSYIKMNN